MQSLNSRVSWNQLMLWGVRTIMILIRENNIFVVLS